MEGYDWKTTFVSLIIDVLLRIHEVSHTFFVFTYEASKKVLIKLDSWIVNFF